MIRKITVDQLRPGMFVVDLHHGWLRHNFWRNSFEIKDASVIDRIRAQGITEISIDTSRGLDILFQRQPFIDPLPQNTLSLAELARERVQPATVHEERRRATRLIEETRAGLLDTFSAVRAGQWVEVGRLEPVAGRVVESVTRNPDALIPLSRNKTLDAYAADHAVATTALIVALGRRLALPEPEVEKLALGALVKDIGEAALNTGLNAKSGALSSSERLMLERHVEHGLMVLDRGSQLSDTSSSVVLEHHERFDGLGYPYQLSGEGISLAGRMISIVDAYDAMISQRPYRRALSSSTALRQIYEQSGKQFDPNLVASFVKTIGIYPVGSLVRLESGHLAIVDQQNGENLLQPIVRVVYHAGRRQYLMPVRVDLSRKYGNHYGQIVKAEEFDTWGLNPNNWQPS